MTHITLRHASEGFTGKLVVAALTLPLRISARIVRRYRDRRELNRLLSMPDHVLQDVGLHRHDIQREVLKPLWRP